MKSFSSPRTSPPTAWSQVLKRSLFLAGFGNLCKTSQDPENKTIAILAYNTHKYSTAYTQSLRSGKSFYHHCWNNRGHSTSCLTYWKQQHKSPISVLSSQSSLAQNSTWPEETSLNSTDLNGRSTRKTIKTDKTSKLNRQHSWASPAAICMWCCQHRHKSSYCLFKIFNSINFLKIHKFVDIVRQKN